MYFEFFVINHKSLNHKRSPRMSLSTLIKKNLSSVLLIQPLRLKIY